MERKIKNAEWGKRRGDERKEAKEKEKWKKIYMKEGRREEVSKTKERGKG